MEPSAAETLRRRIALLTELKLALSEYHTTQAAGALEAIQRLLPLAGDYVYQTNAAAQLHEPQHLVSALFQIPTDPVLCQNQIDAKVDVAAGGSSRSWGSLQRTRSRRGPRCRAPEAGPGRPEHRRRCHA